MTRHYVIALVCVLPALCMLLAGLRHSTPLLVFGVWWTLFGAWRLERKLAEVENGQ